MTLLWVVTVAALGVAIAAWIAARRASARLAQLSDMYWELKYQHLELRKQVDRAAGSGASQAAAPPSSPSPQKESFVPLTSLRR